MLGCNVCDHVLQGRRGSGAGASTNSSMLSLKSAQSRALDFDGAESSVTSRAFARIIKVQAFRPSVAVSVWCQLALEYLSVCCLCCCTQDSSATIMRLPYSRLWPRWAMLVDKIVKSKAKKKAVPLPGGKLIAAMCAVRLLRMPQCKCCCFAEPESATPDPPAMTTKQGKRLCIPPSVALCNTWVLVSVQASNVTIGKWLKKLTKVWSVLQPCWSGAALTVGTIVSAVDD